MRRAAAALLLPLALAGCRGASRTPPVADEVRPALDLFEAARSGSAGIQDLKRIVAGEPMAEDPAGLREALDRLHEPQSVAVERAERLVGLDRHVIDLRGELAGGGVATYSVQTALQDDGVWRVVWIQGPGVVWPRLPSDRGHGLTTFPSEEGNGG